MSKIKIVLKNVQAPEIIKQGDWIDLRAAEDITFKVLIAIL